MKPNVKPTVFFKELSLDAGFAISDLAKNSRIVGGREVSLCSGINLFLSLRGQPIKCWKCSCVADRWISTCHPNDARIKPCLNLYATRIHKPTKRYPNPIPTLVMMTRDHIIPKSLGGVDLIMNLRPACEVCNGQRASRMNAADTKFMLAHPELIDQERLKRALARQENEMKQFTEEDTARWHSMIGARVAKDRKPFKSGHKINTVKGIVVHEQTGRLGFTFLEDDSVVECWKCQPVD